MDWAALKALDLGRLVKDEDEAQIQALEELHPMLTKVCTIAALRRSCAAQCDPRGSKSDDLLRLFQATQAVGCLQSGRCC